MAALPSNQNTQARTLTDKQESFLEHLIDPKGKLDVTHKAAGGIFLMPDKKPMEAEYTEIITGEE